VITASQRRGAELFAVDLAAALTNGATLRSARTERGKPRVVALTEGPEGNALGVDILGTQPYGLATLRALRRAAAEADVVVAYGSKTLPASVFSLLGTSTPLVYRNIGDPQVWSGKGWRRWRTAALMRRAAHIVAVWPGAADTLVKVHGIRADQITVIPRGVPADQYPVPSRLERVAARKAFGLPPGQTVVACIGALSPEKDVTTAISAVATLDNVHLLLAGDGPDRAALERHAYAAAPDRIHFAGVLPGSQQALAAADAILLTSRTEGMPGVLIEAGLAARPAVASDVGGVRSIVLDGQTGVVVKPGDVDGFADGLRTVLTEAAPLGAAARDHCLANFELGVVATRWAELLEGLTR
jgi:glycosyltransferase involved in cell wall biosynthesis